MRNCGHQGVWGVGVRLTLLSSQTLCLLARCLYALTQAPLRALLRDMRGRLARPSAALRLAAAALCCLALLALRASGHEHEHASPASGSVDAELLPLHGAPGSGMAALSEGAVSLSWELLDNDTVTFAATAHQPS